MTDGRNYLIKKYTLCKKNGEIIIDTDSLDILSTLDKAIETGRQLVMNGDYETAVSLLDRICSFIPAISAVMRVRD